jgi:hypothetical protein
MWSIKVKEPKVNAFTTLTKTQYFGTIVVFILKDKGEENEKTN